MSKKSTREQAVELAHASAQKELREADPTSVAEQSGVEWQKDEGYFEVPFLNRRYRVSLPDATVRSRPVAQRHPAIHNSIKVGRDALYKSENTAPLHSTE